MSENESDESQQSDRKARPKAPTASELATAPLPANSLEATAHGGFVDWLAQTGGALAVTTYNSGKLAVFAAHGGNLHIACWKFARPMGLAVAGDRLAVVSRGGITTFQRRSANNVADGVAFELTSAYATGLVDAHDAAWGRRGLYFVNTRFNCVSRASERVRFLRCWQPEFVPGVVASDACHLNGLGMKSGIPTLATAFCESAQPKGWKHEDRFTSGVVIDVTNDAVVAKGLCMPHSPRRHRGGWWLCNSGEGTLCTLDVKSGKWTDAATLPGFTRGLCFAGGAAVVGLSRIRPKHILDAPPVRDRCGKTIAGLAAVDVHSGRTIGQLEFVRGGSEVYDVAFLRGADSGVDFSAIGGPAATAAKRPA